MATSPQWHSITYTLWKKVAILKMISNASNQENNGDEGQETVFQEKYAPLNVRGNFLTLCACPKNVELGEWLAHQIVEQYRLLHGMLQVIQEVNTVTGLPICNENTCPTMSAGRYVEYSGVNYELS